MQSAVVPSVFRKPHPKAKFSPAEDEHLADLVRQNGTTDWVAISHMMPGRNSRQCRDRWLNYLSPEVGNGPWSPEEEQLLLQKYEECGAVLKHIATFFPGRTDINVKSRWLLIQRRLRKNAAKKYLTPSPGRPDIPLSHQLQFPCLSAPSSRPLPAVHQCLISPIATEKVVPEWEPGATNDVWGFIMLNGDGPNETSFDNWF
jgi:hypothetical protein